MRDTNKQLKEERSELREKLAKTEWDLLQAQQLAADRLDTIHNQEIFLERIPDRTAERDEARGLAEEMQAALAGCYNHEWPALPWKVDDE